MHTGGEQIKLPEEIERNLFLMPPDVEVILLNWFL